MQNKKILELKNLVDTAEIALQQARDILADLTGGKSFVVDKIKNKELKKQDIREESIIEGVFDGEKMIGHNAKEYSVPANYASKSKLVEGDMMKLTILPDGTFLYKQIGPQPRDRLKGRLIYDNETEGFRVMTENGKSYKLLTASVTYFKGEAGDEAIVLVPKGGECIWAALENVIKAGERSVHKEIEDRATNQDKEKSLAQEADDILSKVQLAETDNKKGEKLEDISLTGDLEMDEI